MFQGEKTHTRKNNKLEICVQLLYLYYIKKISLFSWGTRSLEISSFLPSSTPFHSIPYTPGPCMLLQHSELLNSEFTFQFLSTVKITYYHSNFSGDDKLISFLDIRKKSISISYFTPPPQVGCIWNILFEMSKTCFSSALQILFYRGTVYSPCTTRAFNSRVGTIII